MRYRPLKFPPHFFTTPQLHRNDRQRRRNYKAKPRGERGNKRSMNGAEAGGEQQHSFKHNRSICSWKKEGFPPSCPYLRCPAGCWCQGERGVCWSCLHSTPSPGWLQPRSERVAALHCNPVIMSIKGMLRGLHPCKRGSKMTSLGAYYSPVWETTTTVKWD